MSDIQRPRGTRDFGPRETAVRRHVETRMRDVFASFGYHEVQTPTFEELALFTAKSGEGIVDELYAFEDKAGRQLALRPELTAPVMRYYFDAMTVEPKPVKLYYFGNCFRYDRPQKGRYREFWQMGCELVGPDTPEAYGEVIALGTNLLGAAGVQHVVVRVGHLGILQGALAAIGWTASGRGQLMRQIDKWDEDAVRATLTGAGVAEDDTDWFVGLRQVDDVVGLRMRLEEAPSGDGRTAALAALDALAAAIDAAVALGGDPDAFQVDPLIARGLDYYTGVVFEMDAPALGAEKQLLGGGAYDLAGVFGAEQVATCGFGLGFDRTLVALDSEGATLPEPARLDVYVAPIGDAARPRALELVRDLRALDLRAEVDLQRRNPGKNLKAADTRRARFAVLLGAKELEAGVATVKDLGSGEQDAVALEGLVAELEHRLRGHADPAVA